MFIKSPSQRKIIDAGMEGEQTKKRFIRDLRKRRRCSLVLGIKTFIKFLIPVLES
jgi:hypothetical protein